MKKILLFFCACCISYTVFAQLHLCPGTCSDFVDNFSTNTTSWQWTFVGANPSTSTDQNPINICYNAPGSYDVTLITTDSAGSDTFLLNNYVTVYPYPPPQGIYESGDTLFANPGAVAYQWYFFGNVIPGATDYFYVATLSGDYTVVATDANGCEVETASFWDPPGIKESVSENAISIYPNPALNKLTIDSKQYTINAISIYNLFGENVLVVLPIAIGMPIANCQLPTEFDISALQKGMYWLEINAREKIVRTKFIKSSIR